MGPAKNLIAYRHQSWYQQSRRVFVKVIIMTISTSRFVVAYDRYSLEDVRFGEIRHQGVIVGKRQPVFIRDSDK